MSNFLERFSVQGSHRPGKVLEFDIGPEKLLEYILSWNFVKSSLK